jgi:hypothetical protein
MVRGFVKPWSKWLGERGRVGVGKGVDSGYIIKRPAQISSRGI